MRPVVLQTTCIVHAIFNKLLLLKSAEFAATAIRPMH